MLLDDLNTYLQSVGIVEPIHLGSLQDSPNEPVVGIIETGGFPSEHAMEGTVGRPVVEEPTAQIIARAMDYELASALIATVKGKLDGLRNQEINAVFYNWVVAMQPPFLLERDDNGRYVLAFNIHVKRQAP